jgi:hypothetical protein
MATIIDFGTGKSQKSSESEEDRYKWFVWRNIGLAQVLDRFANEWDEIGEPADPPPWDILREQWRRGLAMTDEEIAQMIRRYNLVWKHTKFINHRG